MRSFKGVLVVVFAAVVCGVLALGAGSAFGAFSYPFAGQLAPAGGGFNNLEAGSVAVDDANGKTYVADSGLGVVDVFETSSGVQLGSWNGSAASNSPGTPAGSFGGGQVEVAANNATGDVYVLDSTSNVVDVFNPLGGYVCQVTGRATPSASECNGVAGSGTPAGGFNMPGGIAVDQATGDVYVVDANNGVVDVFSGGGAYLRQISLALIPTGFSAFYTRGVAVDDFNGDVYLTNSGPDRVYEFNGAGEYVTTWTGANTPAGSFGGGSGFVSVAADNASGLVYVTDSSDGVTDVFESSGGYAGRFSHSFINPQGTAVGQASGQVYVSTSEPSANVVDIFGPGLVIPSVTTGAASGVGPSSATLNGTVNPDGLELKDCHFEYGASTSYGQSVPCVPAAGAIPADSNEHAVSAHITGLAAGSAYHFRLVAGNANDVGEPNTGVDATLSTPPAPSIDSAVAVNVTGNSADLTARVNPNGFDTTYHFEWGTSTAYGTSVPVPDADIGTGTSEVPVSTHLSGLSANTTYHWRVVARSENGTSSTGDHTFVYDTSGAGLPDGRAYEMVTPPYKNGAQVGNVLFNGAPDISEDGSRVVMSSIQCFGGVGSCGATSSSRFEFTRTSGGWVTAPLAPSAAQFDLSSAIGVSADMGTSLFRVSNPPLQEVKLYVRRPDGSFFEVGPVTSPLKEPAEPLEMRATSDFSHVVYNIESTKPGSWWPFDSTLPGGGIPSSLYEYVGVGNAAPVLVGVSGGRGSTDLISRCGTLLPELGFGGLSADGRTVFFVAAACAVGGSGVNAGVPVPAAEVFARIDESRTVLVSGRSPLDCTSAECLSSPAGDALFGGASGDGSRVFFTSTQQLTDSASEDSNGGPSTHQSCSYQFTVGVNGCNLYEYDFSAPAGHNLVAVSAGDRSGGGPRVQGVTAVSQDGSHVYFVAKGVLSTGANSQGGVARDGAQNLYVFERDASYPAGRVAFVAVLPPSSSPPPFEEGQEGASREMNVTPDGRFLVFTSHGLLTADDTSSNGAAQVFRYDARTGELIRVSVGERGFNDNGNAGVNDAVLKGGEGAGDANIVWASESVFRRDPTMSDDGSYVFFQSPVGLTPQALNEAPIDSSGDLAKNVYEWHEGHVYLISDGRDTSPSGGHGGFAGAASGTTGAVRLLGSDVSGANVFFETADRLVGQDTDTQVDVYDARIGGGFPYSPPAPSCAGEACHGIPSAVPSLAVGVSATFSGAGNLTGQAGPVVKAKAKGRGRHKKKARQKKRKGGAVRTGKHIKRGRK